MRIRVWSKTPASAVERDQHMTFVLGNAASEGMKEAAKRICESMNAEAVQVSVFGGDGSYEEGYVHYAAW